VITVLWEDQRGVEVRGFGPHDLLVSCLVDDLNSDRRQVAKQVESHPKKGNTKVLKEIQRNYEHLRGRGPLFAVVDRDRIQDLWKGSPNCMSGIRQRFLES
jgi:hypothetical protein